MLLKYVFQKNFNLWSYKLKTQTTFASKTSFIKMKNMKLSFNFERLAFDANRL